jgi:hypothetical protein
MAASKRKMNKGSNAFDFMTETSKFTRPDSPSEAVDLLYYEDNGRRRFWLIGHLDNTIII